MKYITVKDIVIPSGTEVHEAPSAVRRIVPFGSILIEVTKDSTAEWTMPLDEAVGAGLVVELDP